MLTFYRLQGYKISEEGVAESEDVYLRRMSGIIRIYAAVLQTPALVRDKVSIFNPLLMIFVLLL